MAATAPISEGPALPEKLVGEVRRLKVDVDGRTKHQVRKAVEAAWVAENREAIKACNAWVEKNGLPLAKYRHF